MRFLTLVFLAACTPKPDGGDTDVPADPSADPIEAYDPLALVNPFIGTGGGGAEIAEVTPAAKHPLGMTSIGPDTRSTQYGQITALHYAGYWYPDNRIDNFSMTHVHGMGVADYGTIPFMARDGWDPAYTLPVGRMTAFTHDEEWATPGRYRVVLQDDKIDADMVATLRGGQIRFTFQDGADPVVLFDLGKVIADEDVVDAYATVDRVAGTVDGFQRMDGSYSKRFGGLMTYFAAKLDPAPVGGGGWEDPASPQADVVSVNGIHSGVWLTFPAGTKVVDLRVAISYVSVDGARANLAAELPDTAIEARLAATEDAWRGYLGRARVRGGTDDERTIFHTALFHSLFFPQRQDDVDGQYRGADQAIHTADGPHYSDLSMWDTFRTLHPWYTLAWPELQRDVDRSIVRMVNDGGYLPKWPLAHGNTGGMVGSPAIQILSESWQKGVRDFDVEAAYAASLQTATTSVPVDGRGGLSDYQTKGYVPMQVSDTLEYAWNDDALMRWAQGLGKPDVEMLRGQADNWKEVWNPAVGFNTGRKADGTFAADPATFDPTAWTDDYVEGNAYHYLWYAPFDIDGMIQLQHGGDYDAFGQRTRDFWAQVYAAEENTFPDTYYWHGNEPVMHYAFLGALAGMPDITADAARWILSHKYGVHFDDGLDGNDDAGTLSAWYLCASTGLFPIAGTTTYAWSPSLFQRVEIDRGDGKTVVVRAPNADESHRFLTGWTVDGATIDGATLDWSTFGDGAEIVMDLAESP